MELRHARRWTTARLAVLGVAAALAACQRADPCAVDEECAATEACVDGFCAPAPAPVDQDAGRIGDAGGADDAGATAADAGSADGGGADDAGAADDDAGRADAGGDAGSGAGDAGAGLDAGGDDAGTDDAGAPPDAGRVDAGAGDAGVVDGGAVDAGAGDAGFADAGQPDAGLVDAGARDVLFEDRFDRVVASGVGAPDVGGPWLVQNPNGAGVAVDQALVLTAPANASSTRFYASDAQHQDVEVQATAWFDGTGVDAMLILAARSDRGANEYRAYVRRKATGLEVAVRSDGLDIQTVQDVVAPYADDDAFVTRFTVVGADPTDLCVRVWRLGDAAPEACTVHVVDATAALQAAGAAGLQIKAPAGVAGATASIDAFSVVAP